MEAAEALEFLASKVEEQARLENVPLSEVERKMLRWSEVEPGAFHDLSIGDEFEQQYDSDEYEAKIAGLLQRASQSDSSDPGMKARWNDARRALKDRDYYLLVMLP
jgi:hypothetical protein